jgi:CHAT domain-containing protein
MKKNEKKIMMGRKKLFFKLLSAGVFFLFFFNSFLVTALDENISVFEKDSMNVMESYQKGMQAFRLGDFEGSGAHFENAINLGKQVFGKQSIKIYSFLVALGINYKNLGEYDKAIYSYLEAEKLIVNLYSENNSRLGFVYVNLGTIYKLKGDHVKNLDYQRATLRVLAEDSIKFSDGYHRSKFNNSEALFLLRRYDEAIKSCMKNISSVNDDLKSFYYSLLARIYNELGNEKLTKEYYQKTFEILAKLKGEDSYDLGLEYSNYTSFLLKAGEFDEALKYAKLSEKLIAKYYTTKSLQYSDVMMNFADYYFLRSSAANVLADFQTKRKADLSNALQYYQKALLAGNDEFTATDISINPPLGQAVSQVQVLEALKKKAHCLETLADLNLSVSEKPEAVANYQLALETISLATELVHQIRMGYVSEDSKFFLAENQEATFMDAVNISYKLFRQTNDQVYAGKGFEFAEKSKSASFLAAVKDSKAKEFGGIPDSLLKREDYLKLNISNYKEMLFEENQFEEPDSARLALFNSKIFQLNEQYAQLVKVFEQSYPNYYSFKYENEVAGIEQVRKKISGKTAVVEYLIEEPTRSMDKGQVFKFVITSKDVVFTKKTIDYTFVEDIESIYQFLTNPNYLFTGLGDFKNYTHSAFRLYEVLLKEEKELLQGKELIIIPDDKLAYVPFDALLSQLPDTTKMNFRKLPYLVNDYSISYTYSATLLFNYFGKEKTAKKDLLAFAPSYLADDRDYTENAEYRAGLLPLPAVTKEVEFINEYVKGDIFKDSLAQENQFKKLAADYDILHLAMHTLINDTLPMYSKLAFSKPHAGGPDDGWLNTNEIYTMALKARMAVLSACNTGSGKLQKGEGVMSLARGFLYAGCPSIVMTLWEVEDESGAYIMKDFYRFLSKGKGKNESLRAAKLAHIQQADPLKAHPHYWLGYVVVGNPEPLYGSNNIYFLLGIFVVACLLFLDHFYRKKKARD